MIRRAAVTVSTSRADDAAFRALADVARITAGFTDARVVGGQMVAMLTTAYPTAGSVFRRTADADAAVSTEVASEGVIHESLLAAGYRADGGNHYVTDDVDIHNLLHIANSWDEDEIGGWAIAEPNHTGSRGDAQVALHKLAARVNREEGLLESGVRPEVLAALIRGKVGEPASFG